MRSLKVVSLVSFVLVAGAGMVSAELPYSQYTEVPPGTEAVEGTAGVNQPGALRVLTFYGDRASFQTEVPDYLTQDFSSTLVAAGGVASCDPPWNSLTNDGCFGPGGIQPGIEFDVNPSSAGTGQLVVLGVGFFGNAEVWVGPNTFADSLVMNFNPSVRGVGFDIVNPIAPGQSHTIEIHGPGGLLGTTSASDGAAPGTFWGVTSDDVGGISQIVFQNLESGDHAELLWFVDFGGTPVPVELQSLDVE